MTRGMTVREAIVEVFLNSDKRWLYKSEIGILTMAKYKGVARNQETVFRELRRMTQEGIVVRLGMGKTALYGLKSKVETPES